MSLRHWTNHEAPQTHTRNRVTQVQHTRVWLLLLLPLLLLPPPLPKQLVGNSLHCTHTQNVSSPWHFCPCAPPLGASRASATNMHSQSHDANIRGSSYVRPLSSEIYHDDGCDIDMCVWHRPRAITACNTS